MGKSVFGLLTQIFICKSINNRIPICLIKISLLFAIVDQQDCSCRITKYSVDYQLNMWSICYIQYYIETII